MLNLIKYEFRKNRMVLMIIGGGLLLLQLFYMFQIFTYKEEEEFWLPMSISFLSIYALVCFFTIFILAVSNYDKELKSKSSYLIFMTPNSSYTIIFSKMLSTLFLGIVTAVIITILAVSDINMLHIAIPEAESFTDMLRYILESLEIPVDKILLGALSPLMIFLVYFFAIVSVVYLSITLSATFLQNSKLKGILSVALFLALTYGMGRVENLLPRLYQTPENALQAILSVLPAALFNLVVMVICIFVCGKLLEKKVSL